MKIEYNNSYTFFCSMLDAYKHSVDFSCNLMKLALLPHGHKDGFDDWVAAPTGDHLTGSDPTQEFDERAKLMLDRYLRQHADIGTMPGFKPMEPEAVLVDQPL